MQKVLKMKNSTWCIAVRSKDDFVMRDTLLFYKEQAQLGWQPLLAMLKTQGLILHGTKLKNKENKEIVEESRTEILPGLQTHGISKLNEPNPVFYDWKEVLKKLLEVGAITEAFMGENKTEQKQEKEKSFLSGGSVNMSEDEGENLDDKNDS